MIMKAGNFDFVFAKRMIMVKTLFCRSFGGNELASKRRRPEDLKIGERLILDQKFSWIWQSLIANQRIWYIQGRNLYLLLKRSKESTRVKPPQTCEANNSNTHRQWQERQCEGLKVFEAAFGRTR